MSAENVNSYFLARTAYKAYVASVGGLAFNGDPLPTFEQLPEKIRDAWKAAARAVADELMK